MGTEGLSRFGEYVSFFKVVDNPDLVADNEGSNGDGGDLKVSAKWPVLIACLFACVVAAVIDAWMVDRYMFAIEWGIAVLLISFTIFCRMYLVLFPVGKTLCQARPHSWML